MAVKIFRINYKSDFILTLSSDAGWETPFCIKFWTDSPQRAFYAQYDGETYTHCTPVEGEPTKLMVQMDDHHLGVGDLKFQVAYHFTVEDFPNDTEDEVLNPGAITTEIDGEEYQVMLDFTGETAPEIQFSLPAYANEAQRIANEQQRIANEQQRISNEEARIAAETIRQQNETQRIQQESERVSEFAQLKRESEAATADANAAADLANEKAQLAADKAALAQAAATLANEKAQLAADKAALADAAATLANAKAALAQQKATYAQTQGDYAKEQGDYAKAQGDYAKTQGDTSQVDHERAEADHEQAAQDHTTAANDHTQAASDHTTAASDHTRAESDHTTAVSDHTTATNDHAQAVTDHTRAESDHTRAESDHAAVEVYVDSLGAFDISAYHATDGVLAKYADLTAALDSNNGGGVPQSLQKGGMSVKFVQSSDNNYVKFFCMAQNFTTDVTQWQGVDDEPTAGSENLVKSGGTYKITNSITSIISQVDQLEENMEYIDVSEAEAHKVLKADGTIENNSGNYSVSPFIEINQKYNYYFCFGTIFGNKYACIAFYDSSYNCLKTFVDTDDVPTTIDAYTWFKLNIPTSVKYIRLQGKGNNINIKRALKINSIDDFNFLTKTNEVPGGINLFNWRTCTVNKYINPNNGNISTVNKNFVSDYIYVKGLTSVKYSAKDNQHTYALYDKNKNKISWGDSADITIGNAVYLRVCGKIYNYDIDMVVSGELPNQFVPYNNTDINSLYDIGYNHFLEQVDLPTLGSASIIPATYTEGRWGVSDNHFRTSDYVEINPDINNHYLYFSVQYDAITIQKIKFYDKDKNQISGTITYWNDLNNYVGKFLKIKYPRGCQYVRFLVWKNSTYDGIYTCPINNFEDAVKNVVNYDLIAHNSLYAPTNKILWVGTSIPAGATYPTHSCEANGYQCINNSKGQQSLGLREDTTRCLTWTVNEYKNTFTYTGETGKTEVTELEFKTALDKTYERAVLPFIRGEQLVITDGSTAAANGIINPEAIKVSAIVIDHGYNDYVSILELLEDADNIDWDSRDRTNFIGAYNYLIDKIQEINPFIKIIIGGYFENDRVNNGDKICSIQKLISEKFHFELFDVWNYSQISDKIVMGTSTYIADFNQTYGTSYTVLPSHQDQQGNIMSHNLFCPDNIHPHSDLTGNCNKHLDAIYTRLVKGII